MGKRSQNIMWNQSLNIGNEPRHRAAKSFRLGIPPRKRTQTKPLSPLDYKAPSKNEPNSSSRHRRVSDKQAALLFKAIRLLKKRHLKIDPAESHEIVDNKPNKVERPIGFRRQRRYRYFVPKVLYISHGFCRNYGACLSLGG